MQVSSTFVIVAAELCIALLIGSIILFVYARKLKALNKKQHSKLLTLVAELKNSAQDTKPSGIDPAEHERQLEACKKRAESAAAATIIEKEALIQDLQEQLQLKASASEDSETSLQILKEELLKTQEELNTIQEELNTAQGELAGKEQALAEQAQLAGQIEQESQSSTESLASLALENQEMAAKLVQLENENSELKQVIADTPAPGEGIAVGDAADSEEKDLLIGELQEQLQRQIRTTQEAETCVQVLSKEILRGKEAIAREDKLLAAQDVISEQNQQLKLKLEDFIEQNAGLQTKLDNLENENTALKHTLNEAELAVAESSTLAAKQESQQNQEKEALIRELQQQVESAEAQREEAQTRASQQETRATELEARAQLLDQELVSVQEDLAKQKNTLAEQISIIAENQQLKQALEDLTQQNTGLQGKLDALESDVTELKQGSVQPPPATDAGIQEQQALVRQLQEQLEQQTLSTQESEACIQALSKELFDLKHALANQEKAFKSQEKAVKDQEKALKKQLLASKEAQALEAQRQETLHLENQQLKEALEMLNQDNAELTGKLNQEALRQEALLQDSEEPAGRPSQNSEELIAQLSQENNEAIARLDREKQELIARLNQESEELSARLKLLEAENASLKQNSSQAPSETSTSDTLKLKKLQAQYKDLQHDYAELEEKYTELTNL